VQRHIQLNTTIFLNVVSPVVRFLFTTDLLHIGRHRLRLLQQSNHPAAQHRGSFWNTRLNLEPDLISPAMRM
jgi:hypothetical protein